MTITEQIVVIIISLVAMLTIVTVVRMLTDASVKKVKYRAIESSENHKCKEAELEIIRMKYVKSAAEVATESREIKDQPVWHFERVEDESKS